METREYTLSEPQKAALQKLGVVLVYLHGSVAAETARNDSDVDIAALFEKMPDDIIRATGKLVGIFAGLIPGRELDIAILNEASPLLKQIVASTGKLLYARSPDDTLRFELRAMDEYEDHSHFIRTQTYIDAILAGKKPRPPYSEKSDLGFRRKLKSHDLIGKDV